MNRTESVPAPISQCSPKANFLAHRVEIERAVLRVLASGSYILGQENTTFEAEFAAYLGVGYAVGVGSGTDALEIALRSCGIGPGDCVITVSNTAVATVAAIESAGALPVLVDINPASFTMDLNRLEETVINYTANARSNSAGRLKAIVPVHLYGQATDMPNIMRIAEAWDLHVIEDCAQAHGAELCGRKLGTWGNLSGFSFYPTKNLGALGDGGMVVTDNAQFADRARLIRQYGWRKRNESEIPGVNSRLDELQAAILRVKLGCLDQENQRRREIASIYDQLLGGTVLIPNRVLDSATHVYHQYVIRARDRDALQMFLKERGIATLVHYPIPVHLQRAYKSRIVMGVGGLQQTENVCKEILSLPIYPELTDQEVMFVAQSIREWCAKREKK